MKNGASGMATSPGKSDPGKSSLGAGSMVRRIAWFIGIWAASMVTVAVVAEGLKRIILG